MNLNLQYCIYKHLCTIPRATNWFIVQSCDRPREDLWIVQPIGYTLSNPKAFPTIEIIPTPKNSHIPLENHGNLQKKTWLLLFCGVFPHHKKNVGFAVGHHPSAEPTAMPLNILAMASRLVGRYTANLAMAGRWGWESWWKHVMFTTHDWEWLNIPGIPPIYIYKNGDDWGSLIIAVLTLDLRNLHL